MTTIIQRIIISGIFTLTTILSFAQADFGIITISDDRNDIDYSQLFKNYFEESPVTLHNHPLAPELVHHYSAANRAISLTIKANDNAIVGDRDYLEFTAFEDGQEIYQFNLSTEGLNRNVISSRPKFSMSLDTIQYGLYRVMSVPAKSSEAKAGLKRGDQIKVESINEKSGVVEIAHKAYGKKKWKSIKMKVNLEITYGLNPVLSHEELEKIFYAVKVATIRSFKLDQDKGKAKSLKLTNIIEVLAYDDTKVWSSELLPRKFENIVAFSPSQKEYGSFVREEYFGEISGKKTVELIQAAPGNSALINTIFYNQVEKAHKLENNGDVDPGLRKMINAYGNIMHAKPAVFINYIQAGDAYAELNMHSSALNQYNAAYKVIDKLLTSEEHKDRLRQVATLHISESTSRLNMTYYSALMNITATMVKNQSAHIERVSNFYNTTDTLSLVANHVEDQIKAKRKKKGWNIVGAIATAAVGVTAAGLEGFSELGLELGAEYFTTSLTYLAANTQISHAIDQGIRTTTASMNFNTTDGELSQYDIDPIFLSNLIRCWTTTNKVDLLETQLKEMTDMPVFLLEGIDQLDFSKELMDARNLAILKRIGAKEAALYNRESRGLQVSKIVAGL